MDVRLAYFGRSGLIDDGSRVLSFAPNLSREAVSFDAPLLKPLRFREGISALHDVVISDLRFHKRDKTAYEEWKKSEQQREASLRQQTREIAIQDLEARKHEKPSRELEGRYKSARKRYWTARRKWEKEVGRKLDWRTQYLVFDPVCTVANDVVVNADLENFFPTITFPRVRGLFRSLGYSPAVATIFALLTTEAPRRLVEYDGTRDFAAVGPRCRAQGSCTSPALSNLVSRKLDARLSGICRSLGFTYTRYADDLSFSASGEAGAKVGYLLARVRHIAQDKGFRVNEKKTRVLRRNARQEVTGIVVNDRPGVSRKEVRRLRAILHRARSEGLAAQNRDGRDNFEAWVRGMIAYISMVQPERGAELRKEYEALSR